MVTQLRTRLQRAEAQVRAGDGYQTFELWLGGEDDDTLVGPSGEVLTIAEFARRYPDAISIDGSVG